MITAITSKGPLLLRRVVGRLDTKQYTAFLEAIKLSVENDGKRFRQVSHDFHPVNRSTTVQQWFHSQDVLRQGPWSRASPDFMPLGDLFNSFIYSLNDLFRGLRQRRLGSEDEMWDAINHVWLNFQKDDVIAGILNAELALRSVIVDPVG